MAAITSFWLWDIFALIATILALVYAYFRYKFQHWKKRNIPVPEAPTFPYGNFAGVNRTKSLNELPAEIYKNGAGHKIIGCYFLNRPLLMVRDLDLVKAMFVKDFSAFHDRGMEMNIDKEPLTGHLFFMKGQEWRNLRIQLTPTFTSGKMKMMFPTMLKVGEQLKEVFGETTKLEETEVKEILSRYTTDVISSVAFGLESNSLKNPDAEFRKVGYEMTHPNWWLKIVNVIMFSAPELLNRLPINIIPKHITDFFVRVVRDTMDYRITNNVQRNDVLQLLMQLQQQGYIRDADQPEKDAENLQGAQKFTFNQAVAQAFLFFFAGFETSSSVIQFALYELALQPDLQAQVQAEIDDAKERNEGKLTYEDVMQMGVLDRIVEETLRKYPVAGVLMRQCNREYPVPGTDIVLQAGDNLWFPIYGYHHDPEHFPEPERFDPDRFLPEAKAARHPYAYLPFGEGPRNCIGNRFALMQTKTGLALVLSEFTVTPSKSTPIPIKMDPEMGILTPLGKLCLRVSRRSEE